MSKNSRKSMAKGFGKESLKNHKVKKIFTQINRTSINCSKNKNFEKAEKIYQELIRLKVKNNIVYFNYGLLLKQLKILKRRRNIL